MAIHFNHGQEPSQRVVAHTLRLALAAADRRQLPRLAGAAPHGGAPCPDVRALQLEVLEFSLKMVMGIPNWICFMPAEYAALSLFLLLRFYVFAFFALIFCTTQRSPFPARLDLLIAEAESQVQSLELWWRSIRFLAPIDQVGIGQN